MRTLTAIVAAILALAWHAALAQPPEGWTDASEGGTERYVSPQGSVIVLVDLAEGGDAEAALRGFLAERGLAAKASPITAQAKGNVQSAKTAVADDALEGSIGFYLVHALSRPGHPVRLVTVLPQPGMGKRTDYQAGLSALISGLPDAASRGLASAARPAGGEPQVTAVAHAFGKKRYDTFSGQWKFGEEAIWLLYEDGWAMKHPDLPLSPADAIRSRKTDPASWVRIEDEARLAKATRLPVRPRGARVSLAVGRPDVSGAPGMSTVTTRGLVLTKDGRFEASVSALASGGWETGEKVADRRDRAEGTYEIDGATITLRFDDGRVARQLFATDGQGRAVLGDRYYFD